MFVYAQVDGKTSMHLVFVIAHCSISFWELGSSISIFVYCMDQMSLQRAYLSKLLALHVFFRKFVAYCILPFN